MNAGRWQQVKAIFHRAVEYDPAARAEFLRESCGDDQELRSEVEALLASEREPGSLLDHPVMGAGAMAAAAPARSAGRGPDDNPIDPMVGRAIGNYIITGVLAHGGMGVVYRARHVTLPRDAVVKCIRPLALSEAARTDLRARFRREAHIQCQLDHPNIVRVYEFFAGAEEYFLVMEYVHGSSLRSMLDKERVLPPEQAIQLTVQALDGLAHAHGLHYVDESGSTGAGIVHRDIKPANLLVDEHGNLKLTDFGIVKVIGEGQLTKTGFSPGTIDYMSPEQIRSMPVDARSDLYSLGVTLYEMLGGRVPFPRRDNDSEYDLLKAHIETDPSPIRTLNPELSPSLAEVVSRSLKRDPGQRWQTAVEFREALMACQQNRPVRAAPALTWPWPRSSRRRVLAAGIAALALVIAAGAFWLERGAKSSHVSEDKASIAVLPFENISADKNQEYFSDGLADELLNALAKTPGLRVAGGTSSFQFSGKTVDFLVIGKKLHVAAILEGSVLKQGDRVRINVRLIKATDGIQLWSETYNKEMHDIFAIQEEIARAVTEALKVTLLGSPAKSTNANAYNAYLQGRYFFARQSFKKAVDYFEEAIKLDPSYAPASVGRAESLMTYVPAEEAFRTAEEAVERALALNPDLGTAHAAKARIQMFHYDWAAADASCQRALALEPGDASVVERAGLLAQTLGRFDEAIARYDRATQIDPLNPEPYRMLGKALYYAGRQEDAQAALRKALELAPDLANTHTLLGLVFLEQGRPEEGLAEVQKEKQIFGRLYGLTLAYQALRRKSESDANLAEFIAKFTADAPYQIAEVYAFRGETGPAFKWLELAYAEHDPGLTDIKVEPLLKSLRNDPRYAALLKKMRLPL